MNWRYFKDGVAKHLITLSASFSIIMVFFIVGYITYLALPTLLSEGVNFIIGTKWGINGVYEAGIYIADSIILCALTFIISVPIGLLTAIYISEFASQKVAIVLRSLIELLVGIPSVVYGLFGMLLLEKLFKYKLDVLISNTFGFISIFRDPSPTSGDHMLLASLILSIMILPIIIMLSEDALKKVPTSYKEGAYALGSTKWEIIKKISIPTASSGIASAVILGMVKAIGEATAITMVMGTVNAIPSSILGNGFAMTSKILTTIKYSFANDKVLSALFGIAFILMVVSLIFTIIAREVQRRSSYE